jgi:hypothetical protein
LAVVVLDGVDYFGCVGAHGDSGGEITDIAGCGLRSSTGTVVVEGGKRNVVY